MAQSAKPRLASCPGARVVLLLCLVLSQDVIAAFPDIRFSAANVEFQEAVIKSVKGKVTDDGALDLTADSLLLDGAKVTSRELTLACPLWKIEDEGFCPNGEWSLELGDLHSDRAFSRVHGALTAILIESGLFSLSTSVITDGLETELVVESVGDGLQAELEWNDQQLENLAGLSGAPSEMQWISRGSSNGSLLISLPDSGEADIRYTIELEDLAFDSPVGRFAGEALRIESQGKVDLGATTSALISGRINSGELLLDEFYRDFTDVPLDFGAHPYLNQSTLSINEINATDHSAMRLEGSARLDLKDPENSLAFRISRLDLTFPGAYKRYFESVAGIWALDGLDLTGNISWQGDWVDNEFESGELAVSDLTVVDNKRRRFAVTGLDTRLRPGDHDFDSRLSWRGLLLGRINLGAGEVALDSEPGTFALSEPLELHLLGGRHTFHELGLVLPGSIAGVEDELDIKLRAELLGLDMELLTAALDWPRFSGDINGEIPAVSLDNGVLNVDGEIIIEVFDGRISLGDLSIERPFGVLPSLAANVDVYNLDLEKLTKTFSFGQISGRLDGYIHDLRLLDWKPVAFDAWFGTPERQGNSSDISRHAVNHLTTIGGGGATTALTGPIMKMFNNFSYRRLGLGCHLQNNVCELRGISEDEESVLIMEGAGLPKIMIRAFNRSLDWPQLVAGLVAASEEDSIRVGD